jgi:hypothetical protein
MKNIVSCRVTGGLGNFMFQISAAYSVSLRDGKEFICDTSDSHTGHNPYSKYIDNIFRKIKFTNEFPSFDCFFEDSSLRYEEIPKMDKNVKLFGYFGSEKYFVNYRDEILDLFEIDEESNNYLYKKYSDLISSPNTCSIHVRRGDYLSLQDYHKVQGIEYFINSYNEMGHDKKYLIFSDDPEWCKQNFNFIEDKVIIEGNQDYLDLYLMSFCKNNIISNSTFGWWGAWLNKNIGKKVIIPEIWYGPKYSHLSIRDIICKGWVIL